MVRCGRWRIGTCAFLVWIVAVAGVIGATVPPAEAEVLPAGQGVAPVGAAPSAAGGQVEALALARFGGLAAGSTAAAPAAVADGAAHQMGVGALAALGRVGIAPAAEEAVTPDGPITVDGDPWEFDQIEQELLDRIQEASIDTVKRPGFDVWPGFGQLQLVGLNTWFKVNDDAWVQDVDVRQELAYEEMIATGNPERVEYEFSDGIRFCRRQGTEYSETADRSAACSRTWEHTTEVEPQRVRARLVYRFEWELHEDTSTNVREITASGVYRIVGEWSDWRDLVVGELGTVASDGTGAAQARPDREDGVETLEAVVEDEGCGYNIFCHGSRAAIAIWKWGTEQWNALSSGLLRVASMVYNLVRGCFSNIVDVFVALKDMISKVAALVDNPVAFIEEQIEVVRAMIAGLREDPLGVVGEMLASLAEKDLWDSGPEGKAQWIGKFGCQLVAALFTGGGALASRFGSVTKMLDTINDFLTRRRGHGGVRESELPGNPRDRDDRNDEEDFVSPANCRVLDSFPTGTRVRMASGSLVPIERIRPGQRVLAADPISGVWSSQLVLDQWSHVDTGRMVTAVLADGSRISATDHHMFWVASDGAWLELEEVTAGDLLLTPSGTIPVVATIEHPEADTLVWEIDTDGPNTFTVNTGSRDVLVHNCGDTDFPSDTSLSRREVETAERFANSDLFEGRTLRDYEYLYGDARFDFVDVENGVVYDAIGNLPPNVRWDLQRDNFLNSLQRHIDDANNLPGVPDGITEGRVLLDMSGMSDAAKADIFDWLDNNPTDRVIVIE